MAIKPISAVSLGTATNWSKKHFFQPIQYVGAGAFATASGSSTTLSVPAASQAGDHLIAIFVVKDNTGTITGFNWNTWDSFTSDECAHKPLVAGFHGSYLLTRSKIHSGSESSLTIGYTAGTPSSAIYGIMLAFRGGLASDIIGATQYDGIGIGMVDASPISVIYGPALSKRSSHLCIVARDKFSLSDGGLAHNGSGYCSSYTAISYNTSMGFGGLTLNVYLGANATGAASDVTDSNAHSLTYGGASSSWTQVSLELLHADYEPPPGE
jgi:hypothetical protein